MSELSGWRRTQLGEIADIRRGASPRPIQDPQWFAESGPGWIRISDVTRSNRVLRHTDQYLSSLGAAKSVAVSPGDLIMSICATIGKPIILGLNACIHDGFVLFSKLAPGVEPWYLYYFLQHKAAEFSGMGQPGTQKNLNTGIVSQTEILLPPLPEQRKIAAILSSVDETIETTQAVIDQLQVVKKALMEELLTRGIPGRHKRFKQTELGEVPEEWKILTYGELAASLPAAIQSGPFGSELKHSEFCSDGVLVIGIDNVLDGRFSHGSGHRISHEKYEHLRRFTARPLDLLITVMATVGRCCVVPANIEPAIITKHVYRLTVNQELAAPHFLMYCLYGLPKLSEQVRGSVQGLSRPGLNKALLLPLQFPIPPLSEQNAISELLGRMDQRLEEEANTIEGLQALKSSLLSVLLSGEVRVSVAEEAAAEAMP